MKKILVLILCLGVIFISGCGDKNEVTKNNLEPNENKAETVTNEFPDNFSLGNAQITFNEIKEMKNIEFDGGDTKIKLNNNDGKYFVLNYLVKNNEEYDIDIDHSVEIEILCDDNKTYFGEYYKTKTGDENVNIKTGQTEEVTFVCDVNLDLKPLKVTFKYKGETYIKEIKN
ncbi:MAG: hypothetical protein E7405_01540 [Ruminococcaceae bacterium]|nr:hypothetical protein [Oscillospiraceae bacterium]